ncbi:MAG: DUF1295 domain-containing protein [Anaerolineaceae bacterium]|jgi:hypothetical protein|nr:DUF1295 domain-containing protein [Anaerolineaceae bacterium]
MKKSQTLGRPGSITLHSVALATFLGLASGTAIIMLLRPFTNTVHSAVFLLLTLAVSIFAAEIVFNRAHRKPNTGLDWTHWQPSLSRVAYKYGGLLFILAAFGFFYWLLPEYRGSFYYPFYEMLRITIGPFLLLAFFYLYFVDGRMLEPYDTLWKLGQAITFHREQWAWGEIGAYLRGWLVKGFFLPLMFVYLCMDIDKLSTLNVLHAHSFKQFFDITFFGLLFVDVTVASLGYMSSLRLLDTHIRSSEPTMIGWLVALICYEPFWSLINAQYLNYDSGRPWGVVFWDMPIIYGLWGGVILLLTGIYVWATVYFGARFSNLTHRGIITNGPYRYTKHPAYLAKNLSWWLISMPFIIHDGQVSETIRHCFLLLLVNGIYYIRAKTEERHLSKDPVYIAYALWIEKNGLFRHRWFTRRQTSVSK